MSRRPLLVSNQMGDLRFEVSEQARQRLGVRWVRGEGTHRFWAEHSSLVPEPHVESSVSPVPRQPPQSKTLARIRQTHIFARCTSRWFCLALVALDCASASLGQTPSDVNVLTIISSNVQPPTVGMEGQLVVILPEAGLTTKAPDLLTPVHLRIAYTRPHGTLTHYDLRYIGRMPGEHDLRDYLFTTNGLPATNLPPLKVSVTGLLPDNYNGWLEQQSVRIPALFGGYRGISILVAVLWVLAFFVILRYFRKPKAAPVEVSTTRSPTFAERLRPLIERAAAGQLTAEEKAILERMLLTHWQRRLDLTDKNGDEVMARLRQHPEAGVLLGALEDWLHRPPGTVKVEVERVLAPYRNLPDEAPVEEVKA